MEEIKKYVPPLQAWLQKHTQYTQSMMGGQRWTDSLIKNGHYYLIFFWL